MSDKNIGNYAGIVAIIAMAFGALVGKSIESGERDKSIGGDVAKKLADPEQRDALIDKIVTPENVRKYAEAKHSFVDAEVSEHDLMEGIKALEARLENEIKALKAADKIRAEKSNTGVEGRGR